MSNIFALTTTDPVYPEYVSINRGDTGVTVTVRSPAVNGKCGETATMTLDREAYIKLVRALEEDLKWI